MKVTISCEFARVTVELDPLDAKDLVLRAIRKATPGIHRCLPQGAGLFPVTDETDEETDETETDEPECPCGGGQR